VCRALLALAAAVAACDRPQAIVEVPFGDHAGAVLIAVEIGPHVNYLALEKGTPFHLEEELVGDQARIAVSFFTRTLADFGIAPGPLAPSPAGGDALPTAAYMIEAFVDDSGAVTPWLPSTRTDTFDAIRTITQPCGEFVAERPQSLAFFDVDGLVVLSSTATLILGRDTAPAVAHLMILGPDGIGEPIPTPGIAPTTIASVESRVYLGGTKLGQGVILVSTDGRTFTPLYEVPGAPTHIEGAPEEGPDVLYVQTFSDIHRLSGGEDAIVASSSRDTWTHVAPREIVARSGSDVVRYANNRSMFEEVIDGDINYISALKHSFLLDRTFAASTGGLLFRTHPTGWELIGQTPLTFETEGMVFIPDALLMASFGGEVTEFLLSSNVMCAATSWKLGGNASISFISVFGRSVAIVFKDKVTATWAFARSELVPGRR